MKKQKWIFTIILLSFFVICNSCITNAKITNVSLSETPKTPQPIFAVADTEGPVIGTPSLDNPTPDSDEDVDVTQAVTKTRNKDDPSLGFLYGCLVFHMAHTCARCALVCPGTCVPGGCLGQDPGVPGRCPYKKPPLTGRPKPARERLHIFHPNPVERRLQVLDRG